MIVVSDTSPISSLLQIGRIEILNALYGEVIVPPAVHAELLSFHSKLPSFVTVVDVDDLRRVAALEQILDVGEAEAIVLAKQLSADFILMDEMLGRKVAAAERINVIGLVGVIVLAKKRGLVPTVMETLTELETEAGFYLSARVRNRALKEAGE